MAAITPDQTPTQPDPQTPASSQADTEITPQERQFHRRSLPVIYRWAIGLAATLAVLIVCVIAWEPNMDFPSEITQQQDDGSAKQVEISRLIASEIKEATKWLVRNWGGDVQRHRLPDYLRDGMARRRSPVDTLAGNICSGGSVVFNPRDMADGVVLAGQPGVHWGYEPMGQRD